MERTLTMALSVVELDEDDCNTAYGFNITINDLKHARSLVGRYYKITANDEWKLFSQGDISKYIDNTLMFRSPITCFNDHYKICKKCFGYYPRIKTPYVGIIAGQVATA